MSETVARETHPLHEYTEPINARIIRKEEALPRDRQKRSDAARRRHFPLAYTCLMFTPLAIRTLMPEVPPSLPLSAHDWLAGGLVGTVRDDVVNATALRPLMDALLDHSQHAIAEFDEIFRERA